MGCNEQVMKSATNFLWLHFLFVDLSVLVNFMIKVKRTEVCCVQNTSHLFYIASLPVGTIFLCMCLRKPFVGSCSFLLDILGKK